MALTLTDPPQTRHGRPRRRRALRRRQDDGLRDVARLALLFAIAWIAIGLIAWTSMPG